MANSNGAFGLRPIGVVGQAANTTGATEYRIAAGNYKHDLSRLTCYSAINWIH